MRENENLLIGNAPKAAFQFKRDRTPFASCTRDRYYRGDLHRKPTSRPNSSGVAIKDERDAEKSRRSTALQCISRLFSNSPREHYRLNGLRFATFLGNTQRLNSRPRSRLIHAQAKCKGMSSGRFRSNKDSFDNRGCHSALDPRWKSGHGCALGGQQKTPGVKIPQEPLQLPSESYATHRGDASRRLLARNLLLRYVRKWRRLGSGRLLAASLLREWAGAVPGEASPSAPGTLAGPRKDAESIPCGEQIRSVTQHQGSKWDFRTRP
jgi:hypothetical protein